MRTGDVLSFFKVTSLDVQNDMVYSGVFMEIASLGLLLALGSLGREMSVVCVRDCLFSMNLFGTLLPVYHDIMHVVIFCIKEPMRLCCCLAGHEPVTVFMNYEYEITNYVLT